MTYTSLSRIPGFTDYRVDWVIKIGGSLTRDLDRCSHLVESLATLVVQGLRLVVVPGGGRPDKEIEAIDREHPLMPMTAHRACALAQDQTGLIIADVGRDHGVVATSTIGGCMEALQAGSLPVLLPARLLVDLDPVEKTWDVTSDAVGAWVAWLVRAPNYAVLTDVDGVFRDGRIDDPQALLPTISSSALISMGQTSIDVCAAAFVGMHGITSVVLNGRYPDRIVSTVSGSDARGTVIEPTSEGPAPVAHRPIPVATPPAETC